MRLVRFLNQRASTPSVTQNTKRRGEEFPTWNLGCRYSHPVTPSHSTVGVRSVHGATGQDLAPWAGDRTRLLGHRGLVGSSVDRRTALRLLSLLVLLVVGINNHGSILLVFVDSPVEHVVVLERLTDKEIPEDLPQVGVVGLVVKTQRPGVVEVDGELVRESAAEDLRGGGHLLLHDAVVLLLLSSSLQSLPGKRSTAEVQHNITQRLHVITTGLLDTKMGVDTGITGSTSQVLIFTVRDVEVSLRVAVLLGETKVDHIDLVSTLANSHEEVVGLDITVDEGLGMDVLDAGDELVSQEEDSLQRKFTVAEVEQILQGRTKKVDNHGIVVTFGTEPADERNANTTSKGLVDTGFVFKLRVFGLDALELNGNLLTGDDVGAYKLD